MVIIMSQLRFIVFFATMTPKHKGSFKYFIVNEFNNIHCALVPRVYNGFRSRLNHYVNRLLKSYHFLYNR